MKALINPDTVIEFSSDDIFDEMNVDSHYLVLAGDRVEYIVYAWAKINHIRIRATGVWREEMNQTFPSKERVESLFYLVQNKIKNYISQAVMEKAEREAQHNPVVIYNGGILDLHITSTLETQ